MSASILSRVEARVLDCSKVFAPELGNVRRCVARLAHASAYLACYSPARRIPRHDHAKPYLSLYLAGSYRECGNGGEILIEGPAAAVHWPGSSHEDMVGPAGLATVVIEFEPAWLQPRFPAHANSRSSLYWTMGEIAASGTAIAQRLAAGRRDGAALIEAGASLVERALLAPPPPRQPAWIDALDRLAAERSAAGTAMLARLLGLHPAWLARAYRAHRGEGLHGRTRRRRIEAAMRLLGQTRLGLADIAAAAGFCDQAHMNRTFRALLGCTPAGFRKTIGRAD
jgi:AraC family transcriptional regulator